ncbi:disease resistance protein L6-like [Rhodamnia argentea]|uniref:Disease resistance protein L6-like n=1 Tax=Rhodamnia argentea TaxID=178133 RepID=A0ABM3HBI9_9MYRT|nr:disease resistance protein L6-like [Rhodamnia argentea]
MASSEAGTSSDVEQAIGDEYQVFLSFRGPDTRYGFTDFLYHGLVDAGVRVFRDEDELHVGEVIGGNLLRAINNSTIYIPIFSQTYAFSKCCLRELTHIVDNVSRSNGRKSILSIFFNVEPEDVKLKTSLYAGAFSEHENKFPEEVEKWRKALAEVDEIKGWNVKRDQSQATIVKLVVAKVLEKLELKQKSVTEHLVGHDDRVKHLTELLDVDHPDVRLIGIYGMGGIGKTTIAKVVFNELSSHFGKCCSFLENVRESMSTKDGIVQLQKKLLSDIVSSACAEGVKDSDQGMRRIGEMLRNKKVLVVLDDTDNKEHIEGLIGNGSLRSGSRIIITTRNTTILDVSEFKDKMIPYEMLKMDDALAHQLFCQHAFGKDFPLDDYQGLTREIVSTTGGLPLAIKVIGSVLYQRNKAFWKETLVRLRNVPEEEILKKLKISYDDLDVFQKQIFLDIACFFVNESKADAIYMWTNCQFYPERGIEVLTRKCLIKTLDNDKLWMHDQLIDMGREIVRQEGPSDLGKRSRLWSAKEALEMIRTKERKGEVRVLEISGLDGSIEITNEDFERLPNLRFLKLCYGDFVGDFAKCRSKLRWISWYPALQDFRAVNFYLDHVVVFKLHWSRFTDDSKAWDLIKEARNLKVLSLERCDDITTIPNLSKCLGLERLTLAYCSQLERIESFIGDLRSLIKLEIKGCRSLIDLPEEMGALVKLELFSLSGCSRLRELPRSLGNLTSLIELDLTDTRIRELPSSIGKFISLRILRVPIGPFYYGGKADFRFPSGISTLVNLEELDLSRREGMKGEIPIGIGELSSLRILNLQFTSICGIPRTINRLHRLQTPNLGLCHQIQKLPELPTNLTSLCLESRSLISVPNLSNLTNLVELRLSDDSSSNLVPGCNLRWIGRLSRLKRLELNQAKVPAPPELVSLSHPEKLVLEHLDFEPLMQLPFSHRGLRNLSILKFCGLNMEEIALVGLPRLEEFTIKCCSLRRLSISSELKKLQQVSVLGCNELDEIQFLGLPRSSEYPRVHKCESLTGISGLSYLKNPERPKIYCCNVLTDVQGLNELVSPKSLEVTGCASLRRLIDASCTKIPDDCKVLIRACGAFVPHSVGMMHLKRYRVVILSNKVKPRLHQCAVDFCLIPSS